MTNEELKPCREAFEQWCAQGDTDCPSLEKEQSGRYVLMQTDNQWKAWQAAWNTRQPADNGAVDKSGWKEQPDLPEGWQYLRDKIIGAYNDAEKVLKEDKPLIAARLLQGMLEYAVMHINAHGQSETLAALLEKVPEKTQYKDDTYTGYGCPKSEEDGWNACRKALQNALREVG